MTERLPALWVLKLQDVILKAMAKKITWWQAAEIIGVSDRNDAAMAGTLGRAWLQRTGGSAPGQA